MQVHQSNIEVMAQVQQVSQMLFTWHTLLALMFESADSPEKAVEALFCSGWPVLP